MDRPDPSPYLPKKAGLLAISTVLVVGGLVTALKIVSAVHLGPDWDTYAFLSNAAEFAGKGFGYTELHRPPFLSWLTSLAFRIGAPLDETVIQLVEGLVSYSGLAASYLLARRRLSPLFSACGALALLAVTPLWAYLGVGYTDIAAVAVSTWALLALTAATEKSPWWYLIAGPLFVLAVLTRFTALLIAFPALVWLLLRWSPFRQFRQILLAAALAIGTYVPAALFYQDRFGDAFFPFIIGFGFSEEVSATATDGGTVGQFGYYARNLARLLGPNSVVLVTIFLLLIGGVGLLRGVGTHIEHTRHSTRRWLLAGVGVAIPALAQVAGGMALRQLTIPLGVILVFRALAPRDEPERVGLPEHTSAPAVLDAMMLAWLLAYLDFHGHQTLQVARYFIPMAPGLVYLIMRGWSVVAEQLGQVLDAIGEGSTAPRRGHQNIIVPVAAAVCVGLLLGGALGAMPVERSPSFEVAEETANWLLQFGPDAEEAVVYSDVWPLTAWYMQRSVNPMPSFDTTVAIGHELDKNDARYYFAVGSDRLPGFRPVHGGDALAVLERSRPPAGDRPRVTYLGKSWDNYVEDLTGYDFYLMSTAGRYGWEGSAFLDGLDAQELSEGDAVAVYGVRWRSRANGERALQAYLEAGGSVVFDAAQNLDGLAYRIGDTIVFDTVIRRGALPEGSDTLRLSVSREFAAAHPDASASVEVGPFLDETGGAWSGAVYDARPGTPALETLAWLGERPLVQVRRVGAGRVYFISYNFVWRAFYSGNAAEAALVSAVFDDAIDRAQEESP